MGYVVSAYGDKVYRYNGYTGSPRGVYIEGGGLDHPWGLIFDKYTNDTYVTSEYKDHVFRYKQPLYQRWNPRHWCVQPGDPDHQPPGYGYLQRVGRGNHPQCTAAQARRQRVEGPLRQGLDQHPRELRQRPRLHCGLPVRHRAVLRQGDCPLQQDHWRV